MARPRRVAAVVLDDDHEGEVRYDGHPVGALQTHDPEVVTYPKSVSKTLSPADCPGWLVIPRARVSAVVEQTTCADWQSGVVKQLTSPSSRGAVPRTSTCAVCTSAASTDAV